MPITVSASCSRGFCVKNVSPVRAVLGPPSCFTEASKQATQWKLFSVLKVQRLARVFGKALANANFLHVLNPRNSLALVMFPP